jgi:beta-glucanase (GH16 family)
MKKILDLDFSVIKYLPEEVFTVAVGEKWANKELQQYVNDEKRIAFSDEGLIIRATYEDGIYKSARIHTKDKFSFQYGRIDFIAKLPLGKGTWPALWMMSNDNRYGHWPRSGEIDIMEHVGIAPGKLYLCVHTENYNHKVKERYETLLDKPQIIDGFHKYSLIWEEDRLIYLLNDEEVCRYDKGFNGYDKTHKGWPFDHPFYFLMNLAVGGVLGKTPNPEDYPQEFIIKSVTVSKL